MSTKLFIGALPYAVNDDQLKEHFEQIGEVMSAKVIMDRETGRSKGFGFVEFTNDADAKTAIDRFHNQDFGGRQIIVNVAKPMGERPAGGGGGGGYQSRSRY